MSIFAAETVVFLVLKGDLIPLGERNPALFFLYNLNRDSPVYLSINNTLIIFYAYLNNASSKVIAVSQCQYIHNKKIRNAFFSGFFSANLYCEMHAIWRFTGLRRLERLFVYYLTRSMLRNCQSDFYTL